MILYTAAWCEPCKNFKKMLNEAGIEYQEIDIDSQEGADIARSKGIRGIPTIEKDGKFLVGNNSKMQVLEFLKT